MTPDNMPLPLRTRLFCSSFEEPKKQSTKQQKKKNKHSLLRSVELVDMNS